MNSCEKYISDEKKNLILMDIININKRNDENSKFQKSMELELKRSKLVIELMFKFIQNECPEKRDKFAKFELDCCDFFQEMIKKQNNFSEEENEKIKSEFFKYQSYSVE